MEKKTYCVKETTILHDGNKYEPGDEIDLTSEEAGKLSASLQEASEPEGKKEPSKLEKLLAGNVKAVTDALLDLTDAELQEVLNLDKRKGVLDATILIVYERSIYKLLAVEDEEVIKRELSNLSDDGLLKVIEIEEAGKMRPSILDEVNRIIDEKDNG